MARILLADDDAASRELVARTLAQDGHAITAVPDGLEAQEQLVGVGQAFDLLVTDVQMPGLDGVTLAAGALTRSSKLAVVLMSGFSSELDRAAALDKDRVRTLAKPFTLDQLRAVVRSLLG